MKYKVSFSILTEADDEDQAIDDISYSLGFVLGEYIIDDCVKVDENIESIFDLEEYN